MKSIATNLQLAAILAAITFSQAQTTTVYNDPTDPYVTTVYYSVCPTAIETTITLSNTLTYCPGPNCDGGPMITPAPGQGQGPPAGPDGPGSEIIAYTTTGSDGKVTEYHEYETVYNQLCSTGGLEQATYTITEECPCTASPNPTSIPNGFTTAVMTCDTCGQNGGPGTVTITTPCSTGPYATVMPAVGPTGASSGNGGSAGGSPNGSSGGSGGGPAGSAANAPGAGNNGGAGGGNNGQGSPNTPGMSAGGPSGAAGTNNGTNPWASGASSSGMPAASTSNAAKAGNTNAVSTYTGAAADRAALAVSTVIAMALGCLALML